NSRYRKRKISYKQHFATQVTGLLLSLLSSQVVSKTSPLLCPISLPNRIATSGSRESSQL
ncbi:MAG: hypothetical protein ACK53Y_14640, partial [bacterium]